MGRPPNKPSETTDTTAPVPVDVKQSDGETITYPTYSRTGRRKVATRKVKR